MVEITYQAASEAVRLALWAKLGGNLVPETNPAAPLVGGGRRRRQRHFRFASGGGVRATAKCQGSL